MNIDKILFLDIETVPSERCYEELPKVLQETYAKKVPAGEDIADHYWNNAALYPEYGKVACISVGRYKGDVRELAGAHKSIYELI